MLGKNLKVQYKTFCSSCGTRVTQVDFERTNGQNLRRKTGNRSKLIRYCLLLALNIFFKVLKNALTKKVSFRKFDKLFEKWNLPSLAETT